MLLFDWGVVRVDLELVYYYIIIDSIHIFVRPSKVVVTLFEELDECKSQFRAEACSNLNLVISKVRMDANIIKLIYAHLVGFFVLSWGRP